MFTTKDCTTKVRVSLGTLREIFDFKILECFCNDYVPSCIFTIVGWGFRFMPPCLRTTIQQICNKSQRLSRAFTLRRQGTTFPMDTIPLPKLISIPSQRCFMKFAVQQQECKQQGLCLRLPYNIELPRFSSLVVLIWLSGEGRSSLGGKAPSPCLCKHRGFA